jgi:hypothetical protein
MKITLESTTKIVDLRLPDGATVKARLWEGWTASGIGVHAYITRVAVIREANQAEFERELTECRPPSPEVEAIPLRLVL